MRQKVNASESERRTSWGGSVLFTAVRTVLHDTSVKRWITIKWMNRTNWTQSTVLQVWDKLTNVRSCGSKHGTATLIKILLGRFFFHGATAPNGPGPPHCRGFTITLGRTPLDAGPAPRRDLYLTTNNTHNRQASTPPAGFEPAIPASEQPPTHHLDRAVTWIGPFREMERNFKCTSVR